MHKVTLTFTSHSANAKYFLPMSLGHLCHLYITSTIMLQTSPNTRTKASQSSPNTIIKSSQPSRNPPTNPTGGSKINTWKCSIALTLFNSPQFRNQTTFCSPQTREKVSLTNPSISALLAGNKSSVTGSEGKENLVQTTRCTIRVSRP